MPPARATPWTCPGCQRQVPPRVDECYCGVKRLQASAAVGEGPPGPRGWPWAALVLVAAGTLAGALVLRRPPPAPMVSTAPPPSSTPMPPGAAMPVAAERTPAATTQPAPSSSVGAEPTESAPSTPTPSPEETPPESLDTRREQAALALDRTLQQLATSAERFRSELRHYHNGCRSGGGPWPAAGCDVARADLRRDLRELETALEAADEQARRSAVYPGVRADLRRRHGLDEDAWAALLLGAREALE